MKNNKNKKIINSILFIRLSSIGDIILTTSLIRLIRSTFPNTRIDFLISKQFYEILKFNPYLSNIIIYDKLNSFSEINKKKKELASQLENGKYDLIIDLHNNNRSKHFRFHLGKKILKIKKNRLFKLCLVHFKKNIYNRKLSIPKLYFDTANFDNSLLDDGIGLEIFLENEFEKKENIRKKIAIAPGAFHFTKQWGIEKFAELINLIKCKYDFEIILLGGKSDKIICNEILERTNNFPQDFSGETSILKTTEILSSCDLLVTNDTGVMHIAAARQVPIVAIFGSTVTDFGFAPYRVKHKIIEVDLKCRPCTHIGRSKCQRKHFNCMNLISAERVLEAVEEMVLE
ncbi:MAG TPA: glycosyltransferase family 9 protein [Candidatus Kapabacteria bacterium]|nr:glycosyltransferase family 9 protein [Candidatus Kapabacteria bacterium]